jgi:ATP-dependent DNA helicase DinG
LPVDSLSGPTVNDIFARLAEHLSGYELRDSQLELADSIDRAFRSGKTGVFEAGTGVGKSFAALIPAILSGKKVVVSTATIALQEQYINKDIPALTEVIPFEFDAVLLKGRGNYLGLRRFNDFMVEQEIAPEFVDWVGDTMTGDISELDFVPPFDVWYEINSDSDDCMRNKCPKFGSCFYFEAKKRAEKANLIIVNHALLLADAASQGSILPPYDLLIVDEAHHLPAVATDAFSRSISNRGIRMMLGRTAKRVNPPPHLLQEVELCAGQLFMGLNVIARSPKMRLREPVAGAVELSLALHSLRKFLEDSDFEHLLDVDMAREKAQLKAKSIVSTISGYIACLDLLAAPSDDFVVWLERTEKQDVRIEVVAAPLNVSSYINSMLLGKEGLESSVWMSATLATADDDPFAYFKSAIGLDRYVIQSQVASPFDFPNQALLYLPKNLPEPNDSNFLPMALSEIEHLLELTEGRAFVLFTSRWAMNWAYEQLHERLAYECRRQGEMPRQKLVEWFKATSHCVLFATSSFWEGVSIDGDQLSCVIIDRIPFQVPDDPVYEAKCETLKKEDGRSWFGELALPYATMRLKQGVGRLIRTKKDRGIVAILDTRLTKKSYGRRIIEALPPMRLIRELPSLQSKKMEDFLDLGLDW